jgi:hypothetical protein
VPQVVPKVLERRQGTAAWLRVAIDGRLTGPRRPEGAPGRRDDGEGGTAARPGRGQDVSPGRPPCVVRSTWGMRPRRGRHNR